VILRFIAEHQTETATALIVFAAVCVLAALALAASDRAERRTGHHSRGVHHGTQAEIRRHRRGGRKKTHSGTISVRPTRTATTHVLDLSSPVSVRHRAALRYEDTGPLVDLDTILGPRPAQIGAAA
jgi:hypothetical protein